MFQHPRNSWCWNKSFLPYTPVVYHMGRRCGPPKVRMIDHGLGQAQHLGLLVQSMPESPSVLGGSRVERCIHRKNKDTIMLLAMRHHLNQTSAWSRRQDDNRDRPVNTVGCKFLEGGPLGHQMRLTPILWELEESVIRLWKESTCNRQPES